MVSFEITNSQGTSKVIPVEVTVMRTITTDLSSQSISCDHGWNHLNGLHFADPNFGKPGRIDLLRGDDVTGSVRTKCQSQKISTFCASALLGDDLLKRFWEVEGCNFPNSTYSTEERSVLEHFKNNHS